MWSWSAASVEEDSVKKIVLKLLGYANKLANQVAKADPWTMIDKIKNAKAADSGRLKFDTINEVLIKLEH